MLLECVFLQRIFFQNGGSTQWCQCCPLTLTDGAREEQAALVAGVTGYRITEGEVTEDVSDGSEKTTLLFWGLKMTKNMLKF